jgi:Xaa-Pro aminopeptidase
LNENDIFFLDLGPIYEGYEGDCGRTFILGDFEPAEKVQETCENIFQAVREKFSAGELSGPQLYEFAESLAREAGYELVGEGAKGHRVSEFPHAAHYRGSLRDWSERVPAPNRWILEIQLRDRTHNIGAFYEDLV